MEKKFDYEKLFKFSPKAILKLINKTLEENKNDYISSKNFEACNHMDCSECVFDNYNSENYSDCKTFKSDLFKSVGFDPKTFSEYYLLMELKDVIELKIRLEDKLNSIDIAPAVKKSTVQTRTGHYKQGVQPFDIMKANGFFEGFARGNIIKYTARMDKKGNKIDDMLKVVDYSISLAESLGIEKSEILNILEDRYNGKDKI